MGDRLRKYVVYYRDSGGSPEFTWTTYAYSAEHARERFQDDGDDWVIISIQPHGGGADD